MRRICFFSGDITRSGGTERVAVSIANGLAEQGRYEALMLSLVEQADNPFFPVHEKIRRYKLGDRWLEPGPEYLPLIPRLHRFLKRNRIDVIVDIDIVLDVLSVPAAFGLPVRVVSWEHFHLGYEESVGYRRMILSHMTRWTDYIITLTDRDREAYRNRFGEKKRIRTIYNPVPCQSALPEWGTRGKRIVTVGRLTYQKGMDFLAQTANLALAKRPDWQWLVIGEGEERDFLENQIAAKNLAGRLALVGRTDEVDRYLKESRIYALTSRWEGLPMCLLEAKAAGLACVSFDISTGPDEIITDGCDGYLVPAGDCARMAERLALLMDDDRLCRRFAENSQRGMERFSLDAILEDWNEVLGQLCD